MKSSVVIAPPNKNKHGYTWRCLFHVLSSLPSDFNYAEPPVKTTFQIKEPPRSVYGSYQCTWTLQKYHMVKLRTLSFWTLLKIWICVFSKGYFIQISSTIIILMIDWNWWNKLWFDKNVLTKWFNCQNHQNFQNSLTVPPHNKLQCNHSYLVNCDYYSIIASVFVSYTFMNWKNETIFAWN